MKNILITGGGGYVGTVLVEKLLKLGYKVTVIDLFLYGDYLINKHINNKNFKCIKGDIRNSDLLIKAISGNEILIHLACISNDPSFELNPNLGKSINYDCFLPLVKLAKNYGINRFIYASSASVYGVKKEENVHEGLSLEPLTDYSKYKVLCENLLLDSESTGFTPIILRPATVCGYSPRLRLDLTVNILTNHAYNNNKITVFGGSQKRPNIHIDDLVDVYIMLIDYDKNKVGGKIYNVGFENLTVSSIADKVKLEIGKNVSIEKTLSNDQRSYHISSDKITKELGYSPKKNITLAIRDLVNEFTQSTIRDPLNNSDYYNIKKMQELSLK